MEKEKERLYGFDNLKFVLIFLVVLGHFLEACPDFPHRGLLQMAIYCFHMPAFMFLTGYFAKYKPKKIVFHFGVTYLLFQVLYLLCDYYLLDGETLLLQFSRPYWLLWYLFATIVFYLLLPLIDVNARWKKIVVLLCAFAAALYAGFDTKLGYALSGARIVYFLPFFLLGFYCGKKKAVPLKEKKPWLRVAVGAGLTCLMLLGGLYIRSRGGLLTKMMYGSISYERGGYGVLERAQLMLLALLGIAFFMAALLPLLDRKLPVITTIGKNCFAVYLLHGFIVRLWIHYEWPLLPDSLPLVLAAAAATVLLCGNPCTAWVFQHFMTGQWIERLIEKKKKEE